MENENEVIDSTIDTETTENNEVEETTEQEDTEALKKKIQTLEAQKDHWRKKAEKVESPKIQVKSETGLTADDVLELGSEGINNREDIETTRRWAKNNGLTVSELLRNETLRKDLNVAIDLRREERKTASVTMTKGGAKGVGRVSDEELLKKREKGEILSDEDLEKAVEHKYESRRTANKR